MRSLLAANISVKEAANRFNLSKGSLQDRISKTRKGSEVQIPPKSGTFEQHSLAVHISNLGRKLMSLTRQEFW
jgi:transposase